MTIEAARPLVAVGYLLGTIGIPALGLVLLIIGLVQRSGSKTAAPQYPYPPVPPPGYPQQPGYPQAQGYPQTQGYPQAQGYPPPGYPQQPPTYPGGYPNPYYAPPQPTAKRGTALIVIGSLLLAFGLLGAVARLATHSERQQSAVSGPTSQTIAPTTDSTPGAALQVGQCITSAGFQSRMFLDAHDCSDVMSTFLLAAKGDQTAMCPDGKRDDSMYSVLKSDAVTLCFEPNMQVGKCYIPDDTTASFMYASCQKDGFKVHLRLDGTTDTSACLGSKAVAFPDPAVVYCIVPASP